MSDPRDAHLGDPCIYCGTPHDEVPPGPCRDRAYVDVDAATDFTPGPWWIVWMPVGDDDAGVTGYEPSGDFTSGDFNAHLDLSREGNALLVQAAPDLFAALARLTRAAEHAIEKLIASGRGLGPTEYEARSVEFAREALDKARGLGVTGDAA